MKLADRRRPHRAPRATRAVHPDTRERLARALRVPADTASIGRAQQPPIDHEWFATSTGRQHEWSLNFTTLQPGGFKRGYVKDGGRHRESGPRRIIFEDGEHPRVHPRAGAARVLRTRTDEKMTGSGPCRGNRRPDAERPKRYKPWSASCESGRASTRVPRSVNEHGAHLGQHCCQGVDRIDETCVGVCGVHYDLDCIVFPRVAVGYRITRAVGFETTDATAWPSPSMGRRQASLHGIHVDGFPNHLYSRAEQGAN